MRIDSYPLLDAFLVSVLIYVATVLIFKLQGNDKFKNLPLAGHFFAIFPVWMFFTFAAVYNAKEKSTTILGTIMLIVGIVVFFLYFFTDTFQSFNKTSDLSKMIKKYSDDYMNPQLIHEIYQYCCNNQFLRPVVRKHNAELGDFAMIYLCLMATCKVSGKGHFVPISTFFFAATLDYVLSRNGMLRPEDTFWLKRYFGLL